MSNSALATTSEKGRHRTVLPATLICKVAKVGYYRDTLPLLIINIKKEDALPHLPFKTGERIAIPFVVNGRTYTAGLRATARSSTAMICSDLMDADLNSARLVDLLFSVGWTDRTPSLELTVSDGRIYCP
ncbi:hypothetical protein [Geotalea sp. SG265]|uniref:hypothetical protein n=1 Tax=Geotalea sp. SG265 TaxID=2922867 RepID=UPI001FB01149|nr:hypothetical protein [Geotalea sp. SG265]